MMFVGYNENHAEMVFRMYHPETSRITQSRDVIWLGRMYHTRKDADLTQQLPIVTVPISIHDKSDENIFCGYLYDGDLVFVSLKGIYGFKFPERFLEISSRDLTSFLLFI